MVHSVQVLYNKELHQVVTTCLEPQVKIWEAESGSLLYRIVSPHGQGVEVTAVTIDPSGYRLVTAAFDGTHCYLSVSVVLLHSVDSLTSACR